VATQTAVVGGTGTRSSDRIAPNARSGEPPEDELIAEPQTGFGAWLRRLEERYPALSRWLGGELDAKVPPLLVSLSVHAALLIALALLGYAVRRETHREFQSRVGDSSAPYDLSATQVDFQDLDLPDKLTNTPKAGSFSPNLAPMIQSDPSSGKGSGPPTPSPTRSLALNSLDVRLATKAMAPTANVLGNTVSIKGTGAEHVGDVDGAVDRLAEEIVRRLEKGRTLVIWAFDASASLVAERERLSKHINTVYHHITELDGKDLSQDGGLLTAVVAFGHDRKPMVTPTADTDEIISGINSVALDSTGIETTFGTVAEIAKRWGHYRDSKGNFYRPMIIVVTDEVGDDESRLEEAIEAANRAKVPVYVLGSQALFGRVEGYMDYTDPKTKRVYRHLPVRQGPESVALEQIKLPFWYDGYQYDMLDSGFGPYALSRLAGATGGIYFITRMGETRMGFDPVLMREYKPDWVSSERYEAAIAKSPLRQAVLSAAKLTQQRMGPQPSLFFPPVDGPEFKEVMADNQAKAALTANAVDEALVPIARAVKYRDREPSRRWQAHYDLIRGRLLAMKIRCYEYNWACATMKKDPLKFKKPNSNAWRLVPSDEIRYSDKAETAAKQARDLLQRVVNDHPGTPWALLAQRELKDSFGFKWVETYVPPIRRREGEPGKNARMRKEKEKAMPKPAEPPKL
jgi:hypothetical protein